MSLLHLPFLFFFFISLLTLSSCDNNSLSPPRNLLTLSSDINNCGDFSAPPCYQCLATPKSKYCRYTKAFKRYMCCKEGDSSDGMCNT